MRKIISALPLLITMASCTTVSVTKVTPTNDPEGIRYALGKPFIKVIPNPSGDGTYTAELVYLPDDNQVYAVKASSFMTKYELELNVDGSGILQKFDLSKTSTSPASEIVNTIGELTKTELDTKNRKTEAAETELKAAIKTNKEEQKKLVEAIGLKKIEVETAANELTSLRTLPGSDANKEKIRLAELSEKKLKLESQNLQDKLSRLKDEETGLNNSSNTTRTKPMAYGPVLFEIKETRAKPGVPGGGGKAAIPAVEYNLQLLAVKWDRTEVKQKEFESPLKPATITASEGKSNSPDLKQSIMEASFDAKGKTEVTVTFTKPIKTVDVKQSEFVNTTGGDPIGFDKIKFALKDAELKLTIDKTTIPPGVYNVFINFTHEGNDELVEVILSLTLK